jgi:hypothetical protein
MRISLVRIFSAFILLSIISGCGVSPILNHQDASSTGSTISGDLGKTTQRETNASNCPLSFPQHGFCAELIWDSVPNDRDPASFHLRFWNPQQGTKFYGPFVDPNGSIGVILWMPGMGHGSAPVKLSHAKDLTGQNIPGLFSASSAYFVMPGTWDVHVQWKDGSTVSEEAIESVQI